MSVGTYSLILHASSVSYCASSFAKMSNSTISLVGAGGKEYVDCGHLS